MPKENSGGTVSKKKWAGEAFTARIEIPIPEAVTRLMHDLKGRRKLAAIEVVTGHIAEAISWTKVKKALGADIDAKEEKETMEKLQGVDPAVLAKAMNLPLDEVKKRLAEAAPAEETA